MLLLRDAELRMQNFQQLANRTDQALYCALGQVHTLRFQMRTDARLQARFAELLQQHTLTRPANETLFLVKYAFFPHTLQPGPGHKSDITKASRYAKLVNAALAEEIEPVDFVAFAKEHGIQRTAAGSRRFKRGRLRRGRRGPHPQFDRSPVPASLGFVGRIFPALELSFGSTAVAGQLRVMAGPHPPAARRSPGKWRAAGAAHDRRCGQ